jgi:dTDP-4-amino-4,6-dideoxygalactose transaminase
MRAFYFFGIEIIERIFHEEEAPLGNLPARGNLNAMQARLGTMQLSSLDNRNESRMKNGMALYERLKGIGDIRIPRLETEARNIFSTCPIMVKNKASIRRLLLKNGIDASSGYMRDCSGLKMFPGFFGHCPNASCAQKEVLYLPSYPQLDLHKLDYIEGVIRKIMEERHL